MKKAVMALGTIFLAFIVFFVSAIGVLAVIGRSLDKESKAYVDAAIPAIVSEWDVREVQKRAAPELEESMDYDDLADLFGTLRKLGPLTEYKGSEGDSNITLSFHEGYEITADYSANAEFEEGTVEILVSLIKHGKQWQLLDLQFKPEEYSESKDII